LRIRKENDQFASRQEILTKRQQRAMSSCLFSDAQARYDSKVSKEVHRKQQKWLAFLSADTRQNIFKKKLL
jgi:hypothetical protein